MLGKQAALLSRRESALVLKTYKDLAVGAKTVVKFGCSAN